MKARVESARSTLNQHVRLSIALLGLALTVLVLFVPGSGAILKEKAQVTMGITATPNTREQSPTAALFAAKQIDIAVTYCSASTALEKEAPELTSLVVPPKLDPHPLYGMAVLSNKPPAQRLALLLLSEKGQAIIASQGLVPLTESGPSRP